MNKESIIVVTGANGMLGNALITQFITQEYLNVISLVRRGANALSKYQIDEWFTRARPEYVFHCAGRVQGIGGNMANQAAAFYENTVINTNIIEACREHGVKKVIAMGSGAVYGGVSDEFFENAVWDNKPSPPEYGYAQAKRAMLAQLECYGIPYVFAISANLYGYADNFNLETGHVLPSLIRKFYEAKRDKTVPVVWGSGRAMRDFMYVDDAARALITLAQSDLNGPVNIGSGEVVTIMEVVKKLLKIADMDVFNKWDETRPDGDLCRAYNLDKLRSTGFRPNYDLDQGLRETYRWFSDNYESARK